jgi:3-oxoacyl-[acyl-carrier-protein] synthase II
MNVSLYITGMGIISPQGFGTTVTLPKVLEGNVLRCEEPQYEKYIAPALLRRMSRVIKMGVASGMMALKAAECEIPDGMITGTGYGCLEDTDNFLTKLIKQREVGLNPTPFIQSTHNTIGSQLALMLKCYSYNQTYSQLGCSFEQALLDASLCCSESPSKRFLVIGVDELIDSSIAILKTIDCFQSQQLGEGAASFVVTGEETINTLARLTSLTILPSKGQPFALPEDVDFVITPDPHFFSHMDSSKRYVYGKYVGEYPVRSGYALALAISVLNNDSLRHHVAVSEIPKKILIHHQYSSTDQSFMILESCRKTH